MMYLKRNYKNIGLFLLFCGVILWIGLTSEEGIYHWQWQRAFRYVLRIREGNIVPGPLLQGLWLTLQIVGVSLILSLLLGLLAAILRKSPSLVGRGIAHAYVGLLRNTPLLIQLFIMYFVLAAVFNLSPFWTAVWTLALFEGSYMSEMFRAGIESVPQNQWDAAKSFGFPTWYIFMHIILPQTIRRMLPSLTNQTVSLIKDSSLVSAIALKDLTMQAQLVISQTFLSLELWVMVAAMYVIITLLVTIPAKIAERSYGWKWM